MGSLNDLRFQGLLNGRPREVEAYFLPTVEMLERKGLLPEGTHDTWTREIDELVSSAETVDYGKRSDFLEEWLKSEHKPGKSKK